MNSKEEASASGMARFIHRAAQPLACARLATDVALHRLRAGNTDGAEVSLRRVEEYLDALDALLEATRRQGASGTR